MSEREVAGVGGGVIIFTNGLADVNLNGLQGFQLDLFYYHYVIATTMLLLLLFYCSEAYSPLICCNSVVEQCTVAWKVIGLAPSEETKIFRLEISEALSDIFISTNLHSYHHQFPLILAHC